MFEVTSSSGLTGHPALFSPDRPTATTAKFLGMIPKGLSASATPPVPGHSRAVTAEQKASALVSPPRAPALLSRQHQRAAAVRSFKAQTVRDTLVAPTVILRGKTVLERADVIVQAADDCGRVHSERAKRLYHFLVMAALAEHMALRPEAVVTPNRMTSFFVVDELPLLLGVCRATVYRAFGELTAGGLIERRPWFTSSRLTGGNKKGTVTGGVVADVVLTPTQGTKACVRADYLRKTYRNLDADRHAGRTSWQWMTEVKETHAQARTLEAEAAVLSCNATTIHEINLLKGRAASLRQSILPSNLENKLQHLLRWTLSSSDSNPVTLTVSGRQEAVYRLGELTAASPQQRGQLIQERAEALCLATGDGGQNLRFWRWLLWRMTELEHAQPGCISAMISSLLRLMTDIQEWGEAQGLVRPLKRAGALFISRLKSSGWWEELRGVKFTP
ncbi:hypothetical protein [Deinococcus sp. UYEF24]